MGIPGSANPMLFGGAAAYQINQSLRFNSADSTYLNRTPAGSGTGAGRTWTWSGWVKRGKSTPSDLQMLLSASSSRSGFGFFTYSGGGTGSDTFSVYHGASFITRVETTQVFRDFSAWYHIVVSVDTTQATAANRIRIYANGSEITQFSTASYPAQNYQFGICEATAHNIGRDAFASAYYFDGYLAECHLVDGTALTPSSFGETDPITGAWIPKKYSGSYGTNGFYLNFSDNSGTTSTTLGKDSSGNGNNWTPNNFSVTAGAGNDVLSDTPTNNWCTLNPIVALSGRTTLSNGNLQTVGTNSFESGVEYGSIQVSSGKWYWENTVLALSTSASYPAFGVGRTLVNNSNADAPGFESGGVGIFTSGAIYKESSLVTTVSTYTTNDIIGIALDIDNLTCAFYKNGTLLTTVTGLTAGNYFATIGSYYNSSTAINFGQRAFAYTPPTGFKALSTGNLPEPTIKKGGAHFNTVLWTGDGASSRSITGVGFQPDWTWLKRRSGAGDHSQYDVLRGATKLLQSSNTNAEQTLSNSLTSFDSDGFGVGTYENTSSVTYVGWNWKANGAGSSNTAGSITSTVSANANAGFSIVTYTGTGANATVGHGLGVAPSMIAIKCRSNTSDWGVYHSSLTTPATQAIFLNLTLAAQSGVAAWNSTIPTSSVFSLGNSSTVNVNGSTYVAYCFSEVAGYSKFGSYTGNGSSDGPFVFCGFKPRWLMIKRSDSTESWLMFDTARETYNPTDDVLWANLSNAESANYTPQDFTSNGFKIRTSSTSTNASGGTYIFAAFAELPFKYANAR